jgi:hypothetical protein
MNRKLLQEQFLELQSIYRRLSLEDRGEPNGILIKGILDFSGRGNDQLINDSFEIQILVPELFPDLPPSTKEVGGRIPDTFHHYEDGSLCLGTPLHIRMTFLQSPTLLSYIQDLVIPYFFSFCYWKKFGRMPFGELSHGRKGIMEYYREVFASSSDMVVINILKILAEDNYRGHQYCPCGSGKIIRQCHGEILKKIKDYQSRENFIDDYCRCLLYFKKNVKKIPPSLISSKVLHYIEKNQAALGRNKKRSVSP